MVDANRKADDFHALHVPGRPFVLFNVWDAGTAKAVAASGARAIATGSWSVAAANGFSDGEDVPIDFAIDNLARIARATALPVTVDIESGYGRTADAVGRTIVRTIEAGAIGCNLEDSFPESGKLRDIAEQAERIRQARRAADAAGLRYFINARTDVFFQEPAEGNDEAMLAAAIERARAYADAGADGLFAPGLADQAMMARLVHASPLPVNIMVDDRTPGLDVLADAGVARVSHGPRPYVAAMKALEELARAATLVHP
jgi:2-methylisocitrate lyase-like PEP mutase family enzyme